MAEADTLSATRALARTFATAGVDPRSRGFWVGDIAYCEATILLIRAQIAAMRMRQLEQAYEQITAPVEVPTQAGELAYIKLPEAQKAALAEFSKDRFTSRWKGGSLATRPSPRCLPARTATS